MTEATAAIRIDVVTAGGEANIRRLNQELNNLTRTAAGGRSANDNYTGSVNRASGAMGRAASQGGLLSRSIDDIRQRAAGSSPILNGVADNLGNISTKSAAAGAGLAIAAGAMIKATAAANEYQDVLAKITTNVDTATFNMKGLSDGILEQAAQFGGMPTQQAEAAYDIISAGAEDASKALELLTTSNKLAVGGITNVAVAADGLTSVVNAYAARGLKAAEAGDAMFISARDGKVTIEQLSANLGQVAPLAATVGVSFDEVTGSIAVLTKGGIKASESVTGVKAILSSIIKPSDEAQKIAKKLGIEFNSAGLASKGLRGVLQEVAEKTKGNSETMAKLYGGVEALVPALALTANGGREFATVMDHMATKAGATEAAFKKMMDGSPAAQWNRVTAAAQVELIKLGSAASTIAAPAFKFLADNLSTIVTLIEVAIIPLSLRMVAIWGVAAVQAITTLAATAAMRFASMAAAQGVLAASTATMSAGFAGLLGLFGGPLVVAIGAAAYGIYTLASNSSTANSEVEALANAASKTATQAANTNTQSLIAARGVSTFGGQAGKAAEQLWQMARAAKAAAVESARLQLAKSYGTYKRASEMTDKGFERAQMRDEAIITSSDASIGERASALGSQVQRGWNKLWAPRQSVVNTAVNQARRDVLAAREALRAAQGSREETYLPPVQPAAPPPPGLGDNKPNRRGGQSEAERRVKQETEFWQRLKDEVVAAQQFGVEQQKITKQQELHKILARDLNAAEIERVNTAVVELANAKSITDLKQSTFELANRNLVLQQRAVGLTEEEAAVQDALDAKKLAALNAGTNLQDAAYQAELKNYEAAVRTNVQHEKRNELLKQAVDIAKRYSSSFTAQADLAQLEKERQAVVTAYAAGALKDALGKPVTDTVFQSIIAGFDQAAVEIKNRPLEVVTNYVGGDSYAGQMSAINKENAAYENAKRNLAAMELDPASRAKISQDIERAHSQGMSKATRIVADRFIDDMSAGIQDLANLFGGAMGDVLNDFNTALRSVQANANGTSGLAQMFTSLSSKFGEGFKAGNAAMLDVGGAVKKLGNPLQSLKEGFSGPNGSILKGMGQAVGGAMAGMQIGETIGGIGKLLGANKGFQTGSKIGGTIGGLTGNPIIAAGASLIGGLFGSLFSSAPKGKAILTGAGAASISGNKGSVRDALGGAAGSVQTQLQSIAAALGGEVGAFRVSIGKYKDSYRVSSSGASNVDTKKSKKISGLIYNGKDEAAAIAAALNDAIRDGAITGISGWVQGALQQGGAELAASLNNTFKQVISDLDSINDPLGASVREVINPVNDLIAQMKKYGASATDLTKLEEYKSKKMQELLKSETASFRSILEDLDGSGGGFSALTQLTSQMAQLKTFQSDLTAGKTVNQDDYSKLIDKLMSNAQSIYGANSSEYQDIVSQVRASANSAISNVTAKINSASGGALTPVDTTSAINSQTDALASLQSINNDYAAQQVQLLAEVRDGLSNLRGGYGVYAYNGRLAVAY